MSAGTASYVRLGLERQQEVPASVLTVALLRVITQMDVFDWDAYHESIRGLINISLQCRTERMHQS
eukprot:scaffold2100_cov114-Skeletonema_marinoi.AAC.2